MKNNWEKAVYYLDKFLDIIYPPKCMACKKIISLNEEKWFCSNCKNSLNYISQNRCKTCGIEVKEEDIKCGDCIKEKKFFKCNRPIFNYDGMMQNIIFSFKYGKKANFGKGLGHIMGEALLKTPNYYADIDYISYVPIHKKRMKMRGFNQSEIITKELAKIINIKMIKNLLIRVKNTKPQSSLSRLGRINNIKNSVILNSKYDVKNKKILLIDDIYTTGSTLNECSRVLLEKGANTVKTATICIVSKNKKNII